MNTTEDFLHATQLEAERATSLHGNFNSAHEAYGVLAEEVEEFWEEVRKKREHRTQQSMAVELVQIAAVCLKAYQKLCPNVCLGGGIE